MFRRTTCKYQSGYPISLFHLTSMKIFNALFSTKNFQDYKVLYRSYYSKIFKAASRQSQKDTSRPYFHFIHFLKKYCNKMDMCREPQEGYGGNFKEKKQLPARSLSPNSCLHVIIIYKTESHEGK